MSKNSVHIFGCGAKKNDTLINDVDNTILVCKEHHIKDERLRETLLKDRKPKGVKYNEKRK